MRSRRFHRYAVALLGFNLGVVLWGAFVRATGSGAGCGAHWPMCNGQVVPRSPTLETLIELTHRLTSGLALVGVVGLVFWAFRAFPRGHLARRAAGFSLAFMLSEAALGAGLVLFELVNRDTSLARAAMMPLHLTNTFLLLGALGLVTHAARSDVPLAPRGAGRALPLLGVGLVAVLGIGVSGAIAALGDTLYPARTLAEGMAQDFSSGSEVAALVRLRVAHPFLALGAGGYLAFAAAAICALRPEGPIRRRAYALVTLTALQLFCGVVNLAWLAPIALQLLHLALADAVWLALVLLCAQAWAKRPA